MSWEYVRHGVTDSEQPRNVWRFPVPGGWLYLVATYGTSDTVFVPNPAEGYVPFEGSNLSRLRAQAADPSARQGPRGNPAAPKPFDTKWAVSHLSEAMALIGDGERVYAQDRILDVIRALEGK